MNRASVVGCLLVAVCSTGAAAIGGQAEKPNIVLILVDNVGYGDLACYGNREIRTPHIDRLAEEGVRCTDFYIGSPSCMPSRGALLTGRHPVRNGLNEQVYLIDEGGGTLLYEGGIRVPCIVRWPRRVPAASVCREPLWSLDLLAMAIVAAGGVLPRDRVLDGRDPTAALAGEAASPHESLYFHYGSSSAVRHGRYKLYRRNGRSPWELFDLETDVGETANLAAREPEIVKALSEQFQRFSDGTRR